MRTELFNYTLPLSSIAKHPTTERDGARMLVLGETEPLDARVHDWPEYVPEGALVVLNDTRVLRARVLGVRVPSGGQVELLFLHPDPSMQNESTGEFWRVLGHASKPLREGTQIEAGPLRIEVVKRHEHGELCVAVHSPLSTIEALNQIGHVPIPPYLGRGDEPEDRERYQTVYAAHDGSVAAPTAGLHMTAEMLERLQNRGIELARVTLHVGIGTFRPVSVDDLDEHPMHSEQLEVTSSVVDAIACTRARGGSVIAVGTTVVRTLESVKDSSRPGFILPFHGPTRLLIQPGYEFSVVDGLLTNFHQPKSTLLALVSAFAGRERILHAYRLAVARGYRFLSYGDAMWLPRRFTE